ncbi:lipid-A-disaccharide synthase [Candidatus Sumerlaeota bacterium]|nr:lipid-A-disaccharide synthase [Candidatus Sumerlaeota bacterium]
MSPSAQKIFLIAGENSGDQPGGRLVKRILEMRPAWRLSGLGGPHMEAAGMRLLRNMVNDLAIVGLFEVFSKSHKIFSVYRMVKRHLETERPDAVILIDYPGFNLLLIAPLAKKLGIRVIYYIMPQVWAWHRGRIRKFKKYCDLIIPILPFEEKILRQEGIPASYLGNPKVDLMVLTQTREQVLEQFGFDPAKKLIGMMPGSRKREVRALLPVMLDAAQRLMAVRDDVQFVLLRNETTPRDLIDSYIDQYDVPVTIVERRRYNVRAAMDFSWIKSGTSTLEGALLGVPFVIVYKVNYFTAWIVRRVLSTPFIGLPNIVAGDLVVPELLQERATGQNLADQAQHYLGDREAYDEMKRQLGKIRELLGAPGSATRTAETIVGFLERGASSSGVGL